MNGRVHRFSSSQADETEATLHLAEKLLVEELPENSLSKVNQIIITVISLGEVE